MRVSESREFEKFSLAYLFKIFAEKKFKWKLKRFCLVLNSILSQFTINLDKNRHNFQLSFISKKTFNLIIFWVFCENLWVLENEWRWKIIQKIAREKFSSDVTQKKGRKTGEIKALMGEKRSFWSFGGIVK